MSYWVNCWASYWVSAQTKEWAWAKQWTKKQTNEWRNKQMHKWKNEWLISILHWRFLFLCDAMPCLSAADVGCCAACWCTEAVSGGQWCLPSPAVSQPAAQHSSPHPGCETRGTAPSDNSTHNTPSHSPHSQWRLSHTHILHIGLTFHNYIRIKLGLTQFLQIRITDCCTKQVGDDSFWDSYFYWWLQELLFC